MFVLDIEPTVEKYLKSIGHTVEEATDFVSTVQAIATETGGSIVTAARDYRKSGGVDGF